MSKMPRIKTSDLPILAAGLVIFFGVACWFHLRNEDSRRLVVTRITMATLQSALRQYERIADQAPRAIAGHPSIYGFLAAYQRQFARRDTAGHWKISHNDLIYLRRSVVQHGWISMSGGGRYYGVVNVKDGFGHPIHYFSNARQNWRAPCFTSRLPAIVGKTQWIYSNH